MEPSKERLCQCSRKACPAAAPAGPCVTTRGRSWNYSSSTHLAGARPARRALGSQWSLIYLRPGAGHKHLRSALLQGTSTCSSSRSCSSSVGTSQLPQVSLEHGRHSVNWVIYHVRNHCSACRDKQLNKNSPRSQLPNVRSRHLSNNILLVELLLLLEKWHQNS